jgi:hypothetical protein
MEEYHAGETGRRINKVINPSVLHNLLSSYYNRHQRNINTIRTLGKQSDL